MHVCFFITKLYHKFGSATKGTPNFTILLPVFDVFRTLDWATIEGEIDGIELFQAAAT